MPVHRRPRVARHEYTSRPDNRRFAVQENAVNHVEIGSSTHLSGNDILATFSAPAQCSKKERQHLKREALLEKLGATSAPYSKSHAKRLKRKGKEELFTDLAAVGEAIAAVDAQDGSSHQPPQQLDDPTPKPKPRTGQIDARRGGSLTKNQRKRTFQMEKLRHTLIMTDRDFSSNPFSTIRTHAQNTLVKHQT